MGKKKQKQKNNIVKISTPRGNSILRWIGKEPVEFIKSFPSQPLEIFDPLKNSPLVENPKFSDLEKKWSNLLFHGENKEVLGYLLNNGFRGKIDLIYIDPPFNVGLDYVRKVKLRNNSDKKLEGEGESFTEQLMYFNNIAESAFLSFMYERIQLLSELLCEDGLLFLRIDYRYSHYLKIICDEVFSRQNFVNEIIISRSRESAGSPNKLEVSNEYILLYSNSSSFKLNKIRVDRSLTDIKWTSFLMGGERHPRERIFFGLKLTPPAGQHFTLKQPKCDKLVNENYIRLRCKNCGALFYYSDSETDLQKRIKSKKNKFKFYDLTTSKNFFAIKNLSKCLECSNIDFVVEYLGSEETTLTNNWLDIRSYSTSTDYPTENSEDLLERVIKLQNRKDAIVLDCFLGSGTTVAVAQKLNKRWIGCDINKGSIQTSSKRIQEIVLSQIKNIADKDEELFNEEDNETNHFSFATYKVNDYDLQILHTEAIELASEHIGIKRTKTDKFFDGLHGKNLVKIIDFHHPLSLYDLQLIQDELKKRPDEDRNITVVCLGKELAVDNWIEDHNRVNAVNTIGVIELRTDSKYGKFLIHKSCEAKVKFRKEKDKVHIEINDFISPTILERLNIDDESLFKVKIPDFRSMIDVVLIDNNYNGKVFNIYHSDVPEKKNDFVKGKYEIEIPKEKVTIAVKIIDMLGEEILLTKSI